MTNPFFRFFRQGQRNKELIEKNKELVSLNEKLRDKNRKLSEKIDVHNRLLSFIAHDFRGPVSNATWLCSMYESDEVSEEEFSAFIKELRAIAENSLNGFDNTLQWVKSQWDGIEMRAVPIAPYTLLEEMALYFKEPLEKKGLRLTVQGDREAILQASPELMQFVLKNLLSNAIKFSYPGGAIMAEVEKKDANHLRISIKDSGIGMDAETLELLFTHEQRTATGTGGEKGAGIALMICKDFVEMCRGVIRAESAPEHGTVFRLDF